MLRKDVLILRQGTVILYRVAWGGARITSQAAQLEEAKMLRAQKEEPSRQVTREFWRSESTHSGGGAEGRQASFPVGSASLGKARDLHRLVRDEQSLAHPESLKNEDSPSERVGEYGIPGSQIACKSTSGLCCEPGIAPEGRFFFPYTPSKGAGGLHLMLDKFVDK